MSLTVLSIAYPFAPVGLQCVGGAEQVLTDIDHALVAAGHTSLVLACEGSTTAGKLFSLPRFPNAFDSVDECSWRKRCVQTALDCAISMHHIDLIHVHDTNFYEYKVPLDIPVLVTLHLPITWYPEGIWRGLPENMWLQCVSETQRLSCPPELRNLPVVANGVDLTAQEAKGNFAMTLGRICPEKNQHAALEAGLMSDIRVVLGGEVFPWKEHRKYFHEKVEPLLHQKREGIRHEFFGPLDQLKKQKLLAQAKCLLHPTLAPETSSLVAMEALAAGTPVIAYRSGALPEIVQDGVTGFLVDSIEEMAAAIHRSDTVNPEMCRTVAAERFSKVRMIEQYFHLYSEIIRSRARERLYA
jgi:glycosyltransferase involved in cell wall biosynthesis